MYANGFVQGPAEALDTEYYAEREAAMQRAKQLYLRGAALLYSALEKKYPGLGRAEEQGELASYLAKMGADDVPLLYWTAAGMLSAYSLDVFDFDLGAKIPELSGFIARAYELDPDFNRGAIDEFYILYYAALPEIMGGDKARAEQHFNRALEKSERLSASPYLYYAQGICVPAQDYEGFKEKLNAALAIDVDAAPSLRLMNILAQRKARRLLDRAYYYFSFLSEDDYDNW
jgi:predicted anti-sigma-YlaC factor YlaD